MDRPLLPIPARYRVEHQATDLAPLILGVYTSERGGVTAFHLALTNHRLAGRAGWIVLIDQSANPEQELRRQPIPAPAPPELVRQHPKSG